MDLETYFSTEYPADAKDIVDLEQVLNGVVPTLLKYCDPQQGWPYAIEKSGPKYPETQEGQPAVSHSTTAMVLNTLFDIQNGARVSRSGPDFGPVKLGNGKELAEKLKQAQDLLIESIVPGDVVQTASGTYGDNDPLTAAWIAGISRKLVGEKAPKIAAYVAKIGEEFSTPDKLTNGYKPPANYEYSSNAFMKLRVVQLLRTMSDDQKPLMEYKNDFERCLHEHLSFSSIPDSRFDPAELAFCLEGMLLAQQDSVDDVLFNRVVDVLAKAQQESASWRPVKPLLTTRRGLVLFPVSVEVANSLLRSCVIMDGDRLHDTFSSKCLPLFRRYWQWLRARKVAFIAGSSNVVGWHSEHVNNRDVVHPWETSQVVGFLLQYRGLLKAHIARTSLVASKFSVSDQEASSSHSRSDEQWLETEAGFEPVTFLGDEYAVYKRVGDGFVKPRNAGKDKLYSMLLYGPPGTGKTTVAGKLAAALGRRLITITVSDFLSGGEAELEARTKRIFDVLVSQPECVILFDEIDNFLLDRDSERYSKDTATLFQFMTPGMLTKLNDLRKAERPIFVIATNYETRIDSAIKRKGRVDEKILVLPPDLERRKNMLKKILEKLVPDLTEAHLLELAQAALFLGYSDIEGAAKSVEEPANNIDQLKKKLEVWSRATSIEVYARRLEDKKEAAPLEEIFCLIALYLEAGRSAEAAAFKSVAGAIRSRIGSDPPQDAVRRHAPSMRQEWIEKVGNAISSALS